MLEVEYSEDQHDVLEGHTKVRVIGSRSVWVHPDNTKTTVTSYAIVPNSTLEFIDGKWYFNEPNISIFLASNVYKEIKVDWGKIGPSFCDPIDATFSVDNDQMALPSES